MHLKPLHALLLAMAAILPAAPSAAVGGGPGGYAALVELFVEWRAFAQPGTARSVPDYRPEAMAAKAARLPEYRRRLEAIDPSGWPVEQRTDFQLVRAEMNGLDFDLRVLRPWARDPAFYATVWPSQTDVPARDGPAATPSIELYLFAYPLAPADQQLLAERLAAIPPLLEQARGNLADSNARDLWVFGTQRLREQAEALAAIEQGEIPISSHEGRRTADFRSAMPRLRRAMSAAREATERFVAWLEARAPTMTGPSGVGRENYSWYVRNVHLLPYGWEEEVVLLRRELERAHAALRLEEHRNRMLPALEPVADAGAYESLSRQRLDRFVRFLVEGGIVPDRPYLRGALAAQLGGFVPPERREFFHQMTHREPMTLLAHDYHWLDLARMRAEPHASPIRRVPSLSNIFDHRAEGLATGFEELVMHAGLYDDNPRARELVWIMLANRAARGLASLYVQANEIGLEEAGRFHARWTPRKWVGATDGLTAFEQLLYLRQPGYGTSYISGKLLFDRLLAQYSHEQEQAGRPFVLRDFMGRVNDAGMVPFALMEQELIQDPEAIEPR